LFFFHYCFFFSRGVEDDDEPKGLSSSICFVFSDVADDDEPPWEAHHHFLVFFSGAKDDNEPPGLSSSLDFFPQMQKMTTSWEALSLLSSPWFFFQV